MRSIQISYLALLLGLPGAQTESTASTATTRATTPKTAREWFEALDVNHNALLDEDEFIAGYEKILSSRKWSWPSPPLLQKKPDKLLSSNINRKSPENNFWKAFTSSLAMIIATEIGDKTFFIAAVLSMKHDRSAVLLGALVALFVMTILSTAMGLILPQLVDRQYTGWLSAILFLYFGAKMLYEAKDMASGKASDELEEVEEELLMQGSKKNEEDVETGTSQRRSKKSKPASWHKIALQSLSLTFLAEWGDRSQIATIALAASHDPIGVTIGGCLGHALCTSLAVVGGRMLAARISEKTVAMAGGALFLLFGLHSMFVEEFGGTGQTLDSGAATTGIAS